MKTIIKLTVLMCFVTSLTFAQKLKVTGGVNIMYIDYAVSTIHTENPTDGQPTDTDLTTKFTNSKSTTSYNSSINSTVNFSKTSSETGFYLGLALADINLADKLELLPEVRLVAVKDFNQIQVPVLASYNISDKFKAKVGPSLGFLLDTGEGVKSTNFAIDFGLSYDVSDKISIDARYDWGQTNLLDRGDSDNYLKINNIQIGLSYSFN
ncbi:porin family protein [Seonamhaeicola algicola]|uniref:Porin family protein n=1 Tax=Seonamhaeicola algicola TaxID=1719036 RepID=A0A5C7AQZ7_9FLAO|nr:outer membrane beta-barrel protein [Seonamhaeicola algicola]TXE10119.1 porin family protein [Seonamhaeicola algicola]